MILQSEEGECVLREPRKVVQLMRGFIKRGLCFSFWRKFFVIYGIFLCLGLLFFATRATGSFEEEIVILQKDGLFTYSSDFLKKEVSRVVSFEAKEGLIWLEEDLTILVEENKEKEALQKELEILLSGYPMKETIPFLLEQDSLVMAFLVGIAKKESNWGKHVPLDKNGNDCYNYWGYRAPGSLGVQYSGYGCFSSPEEAISVVGERIHKLAIEYKRKTPREMIVWKCGSTCEGHTAESVSKWIQDVNIYYTKVLAMTR
ncbi:MAG: hypothetical protein EOM19_02935 [Candidatus Moranbacteria bacterium]|nr:hypothetical protein [Candidatus Moranbacteria bacterium]